MIAGKDRMRSTAKNFLVVDLFFFWQTPRRRLLYNFDRPEVAKLRGSGGRDPREKSEAVEENTVMQTASQAELSRCQQQAALMQQLYNQSFQNQQCCCETQRLIERTSCDAAYAAATNAANIIQNAHNDTDRVIAKLDAMEMARKDETIAALRQELQTARFQASQRDQNGYFDAVVNAAVARLQGCNSGCSSCC